MDITLIMDVLDDAPLRVAGSEVALIRQRLQAEARPEATLTAAA